MRDQIAHVVHQIKAGQLRARAIGIAGTQSSFARCPDLE